MEYCKIEDIKRKSILERSKKLRPEFLSEGKRHFIFRFQNQDFQTQLQILKSETATREHNQTRKLVGIPISFLRKKSDVLLEFL
ncbi:hypothetical protein LEP1GSC100_3530 [Leptospira interrogans serovar Bataviae str. UI 08561]|nr:hypothetical protein LEP1GSC100_3530 [Leptospira interrogans serovar Bataviae str. UI 08561]